MREKEAKKYVGEKNWDSFNKWMKGQTVKINPDGTIDFYTSDINKFMRNNK